MYTTTGSDLCRVAIVAPHRRIDLSLPADIPLAHMLPTLLQVAGADLADSGLRHSSWILQRLDEPPLDESRSLSDHGVRDGELLYFRPELAQLPEVTFDDVADVVATGVNEYADRWRPETTRRVGLAGTAVALLAGAAALALAGPPWGLAAAVAGAVALALTVGAAVLSRALGDAAAGAVLGWAALPYAFLGGLLAPARPVGLASLGAPHLLAGSAAVTAVAAVCAVSVVDGLPAFLGGALTALLGAIAAALVQGAGLDARGTAALFAAVCLAFTAFLPSMSFRLARLPLPPVPETAEELRDAQTFDGPTLLRRTREADRFGTGLVAAVALVCLGAQAFLVTGDGWMPATMSACVSAVLLLRARVFVRRPQRLWLLGSGAAGPVLLALAAAGSHAPRTVLLAVVLPALAAATVAAVTALRLPVRKPSPFWGRAGDILDMTLIVSLFPLAVGLLGLYSRMRGLAG